MPPLPPPENLKSAEAEVLSLIVNGERIPEGGMIRIPTNKPVHVKGRIRLDKDTEYRDLHFHGVTRCEYRIQVLDGWVPLQPEPGGIWSFDSEFPGPKNALPMDLRLLTRHWLLIATYPAETVAED